MHFPVPRLSVAAAAVIVSDAAVTLPWSVEVLGVRGRKGPPSVEKSVMPATRLSRQSCFGAMP